MEKFVAAAQTKVASVEVDGKIYELRRLTLGELKGFRSKESSIKDDPDAAIDLTLSTLEMAGLPREAAEMLAPEDIGSITEIVAGAKKKWNRAWGVRLSNLQARLVLRLGPGAGQTPRLRGG